MSAEAVKMWNAALAAYIFNSTKMNKPVSLGLEADEIVEAGAAFGISPSSTAALVSAVSAGAPKQLIENAVAIHRAWRRGPITTSEPPFLAHLVLLVHALIDTSDGSFDDRTVHPKLSSLLGVKRAHWPLKKLTPLWSDLESWANVTMAGSKGIVILFRYGKQPWVSFLRGQAILTAKDRDILTWIFLGEDIPPGSLPDDHEIEVALHRGVSQYGLPQRVLKALDQKNGRRLLLGLCRELVLSWDGNTEGANPRRAAGQEDIGHGLRLVLARRGGVPVPGAPLGELTLQIRSPRGSDLDLSYEGMQLKLPGGQAVNAEAGMRQGWTRILKFDDSGDDVAASDAGWPALAVVADGAVRASRLATSRAILESLSWSDDLAELTEASRPLEVGRSYLILAQDYEQLCQAILELGPSAAWQPVGPQATGMHWRAWRATRALVAADVLGTPIREASGQRLHLHVWPRNRRDQHLQELPLWVETDPRSTLSASHAGEKRSVTPNSPGVFVLRKLTLGVTQLESISAGTIARRTVYVEDLLPIVKPQQVGVDSSAVAAGISGAHPAPLAAPSTWASSASSTSTRAHCPHLACVSGGKAHSPPVPGELVLSAISSSDRTFSWQDVEALLEDLGIAGENVGTMWGHVGLLQKLGHLDRLRTGAASTLLSAAPVLAALPAHADLFVLCGGRTARFARDFEDLCQLVGLDFLTFRGTSLAPPALFARGDAHLARQLCELSESLIGVAILMEEAPPAWSMLSLYEGLKVESLIFSRFGAPGTWSGWKGWETIRASWNTRPRKTNRPPDVRNLPTVLRYQRRNEAHHRLVRASESDGVEEAAILDPDEGRWAALSLAGETVASFFHDADRCLFAIRSFPRLPWLIARALTLFSGLPPGRMHAGDGHPSLDVYWEIPREVAEYVVSRLGAPTAHLLPISLNPVHVGAEA